VTPGSLARRQRGEGMGEGVSGFHDGGRAGVGTAQSWLSRLEAAERPSSSDCDLGMRGALADVEADAACVTPWGDTAANAIAARLLVDGSPPRERRRLEVCAAPMRRAAPLDIARRTGPASASERRLGALVERGSGTAGFEG